MAKTALHYLTLPSLPDTPVRVTNAAEVGAASLPPAQTQADLAIAIRQAVRDVTKSDGSFRCQLDSGASAILATALTGQPYTPRMLRIPTLICASYTERARWYEFVAALRRPGTGIEPETAEKYQIEHCFAECSGGIIIDVSTWQLRQFFADRFRVAWKFHPDFFWNRAENLPREVQPWYSVSPTADYSDEYFEALPLMRDKVEAIVARAAELLSGKGYQMPAELFPDWFLERPAVVTPLSDAPQMLSAPLASYRIK